MKPLDLRKKKDYSWVFVTIFLWVVAFLMYLGIYLSAGYHYGF